jgi:flagellar M-ring protein FliF
MPRTGARRKANSARTIMASPLIRSARVHISTSGSRPFVRAAAPSASVSIIPASAGIPPEQAAAIRYLVSSAVAGLDPAASPWSTAAPVASSGGDGDSIGPVQRRSGRRAPAAGRAPARSARRPGNALVEVAIETVTESEQIVERRLDPDSRVLISTEVEERANSLHRHRAGKTSPSRATFPTGMRARAGSNQARTIPKRGSGRTSTSPRRSARSCGFLAASSG